MSSNFRGLNPHWQDGIVFIHMERTAEKLASALEVGVDWYLTGDEEKKYNPVDGKLTDLLWQHPEVREELWKRMRDE